MLLCFVAFETQTFSPFSTWEFGRLFSLLHMSHLNWQWSSDCLFVWWWIKNNGITHNRWNLSFDKIGKLILARCVSIRFIRTLFFLMNTFSLLPWYTLSLLLCFILFHSAYHLQIFSYCAELVVCLPRLQCKFLEGKSFVFSLMKSKCLE